jgi:tetratricopeptide (TPR) repeat protein
VFSYPVRAATDRLQVVGEIVSPTREFRRIQIESIDRRFVEYGDIDSNGRFSFKKIPEGLYKLTLIGMPGAEQRTIEVRRAFADARGRVIIKIELADSKVPKDGLKVGVAALGVSSKAMEEAQRATEARGDIEKARAHLQKAIDISPNFDEALNNLGTIYYGDKQFEKAAELFERALQANPNSFAAQVNLVGALLSLGRYEQALLENLKAIEMRPADSLAQSQTGQSLFYLKRFDEALVYLNTAERLDLLSFTLPGIFIARIREIQGDWSGAIAEYKEFLRVHPGHPQTSFVESQIRNLERTRRASPENQERDR